MVQAKIVHTFCVCAAFISTRAAPGADGGVYE